MHRSWIIQHRASDQAMYASMLPSPPLRKSLVSGMQSSCKAVVKLLYSLPDPTKSLVAGMCCDHIFFRKRSPFLYRLFSKEVPFPIPPRTTVCRNVSIVLPRTAYPTFVPAYQLISESGCHSTPIYTYVCYIYMYIHIHIHTCIYII
jgi:hypothetical protein